MRDAKKIQDRKKAQELAAEKLKQDQKWVLRDRKVINLLSRSLYC